MIAMHWLDHASAWVVGRPRFFAEGWGDMTAATELAETVSAPRDPSPIRPVLQRRARITGVEAWTGSFESPARGLPAETRTAHFELLLPVGSNTPPVCVHLASMGDEGLALRRRLVLPLVRQGMGALLLENPYYGRRRRAGQHGPNLRVVADHLTMNRATIEEARSLLGWLRAEGHTSIGVSGYSMGGSMAAYTAVCTPFPVAVMSGATGDSVGHLATRDVPSLFVHWDCLGPEHAARRRFYATVDALAFRNLPLPRDPHRAVFVGCRADGYVDPLGVGELHRHWIGSTLRWINSGHVGGALLHASALRQGILEAMRG